MSELGETIKHPVEAVREARDRKLREKIDATPHGQAMKQLWKERDERSWTNDPLVGEEFRAKFDAAEKLETKEDEKLADKKWKRHVRRTGRGAGVVG
jgi:hypothetical protein